MGKKHRNGRSVGDGRFVSLYEWLLKSPAYRSLTVASRALYVEFKRRYNGTNNGDIIMSYREAEAALGVGNRVVMKAIKELEGKGFIRAHQKGAFDWKARLDGRPSRATTWVLTEFPVDVPVRSLIPEKTFMNWRPPSESKTRGAKRTRHVCKLHAIEGCMVCKPHADGVQDARDKGQSDPSHGVQDACTTSLPYTPRSGGDDFHPLHISNALKRVLADKKGRAA